MTEDPKMRHRESPKSEDTVQVQVIVDPQTLTLIEAYRRKSGLSSRAQAAKALIAKGLLHGAPQAK
jgi:hypothetical protein